MATTILFIDELHILSKLAEIYAKKIANANILVESAGYGKTDDTTDRAILLHECGIESDKFLSCQDIAKGKYNLIVAINEKNELSQLQFAGAPPVVKWKTGESFDLTPEAIRTGAQQIEKKVAALFRDGFLDALVLQKTRLESILDSLHEGIIAHGLDRKVFFFSRGAEILTGAKKEDVLGMDCHELFEPHFCGDQCIFCNQKADYSCMKKSSYSAIFITPDGIRKEFEITRFPFTDEQGNVIGAVAAIQDSTRVHELEFRLGEAESFSGIIGQDYKMLQVFELIKDLGQSDFPVVITGESGTGKELVAAALHKESYRRDRLFVPINCGALPEGTLESELFGHVKGAFTGAIRDKKGRFELADKGTLFLDEIAELSLQMQVKLLRVLQEGVVEPVGSESGRKIDVRILCATNKNLKEMVARGTFREDLYYRLAVVPIVIPPLRERRNDIALLTQHFLNMYTSKLSKAKVSISEDALSLLMSFQWPGNVRQLQNAIQFALIKCRGTIILPEHLPPEIVSPIFTTANMYHSPGKAGRKPKLTLEIVENALVKAGGNKAKAARYLGVGRATLYNFINANKGMLEPV